MLVLVGRIDAQGLEQSIHLAFLAGHERPRRVGVESFTPGRELLRAVVDRVNADGDQGEILAEPVVQPSAHGREVHSQWGADALAGREDEVDGDDFAPDEVAVETNGLAAMGPEGDVGKLRRGRDDRLFLLRG